jgi:hypothetical protein
MRVESKQLEIAGSQIIKLLEYSMGTRTFALILVI